MRNENNQKAEAEAQRMPVGEEWN